MITEFSSLKEYSQTNLRFFSLFLSECQYDGVLDYEEKVAEGFYDVLSLSTDPANRGKMPSLTDLETNPGGSNFEVVIVNRKIDPALEELIQIAQCIELDCPTTEISFLVQRLAELVTDHMGGPVKDVNVMVARWMERSTELRTSLHTAVLPLGSLKLGLLRHRALLFKVRADINFMLLSVFFDCYNSSLAYVCTNDRMLLANSVESFVSIIVTVSALYSCIFDLFS